MSDLSFETPLVLQTVDRTAITLRQKPVWQAALDGATGGLPRLVQRLDTEDEYYFIVPYLKHGVETARFAVDVRTKSIKEIGAIEDVTQTLVTFIAPTAVMTQVSQRSPRPSWLRFRFRPEATCQHETLVWKSCIESRSMLRPFYLLTVGDQTIYVRTDGEIFPSLRDIPDA